MPHSLLSWLRSYLSGRTQFVKINGELSREITVKSGVPQGSHLGPLFFILFINDLSLVLHEVNFWLYADDLKMCKVVKNVSDVTILQNNFYNVAQWCKKNGMTLNLDKCNSISFTRSFSPIQADYEFEGYQLKRVKIIKDLGVWLDCRMTYKHHLDITIGRATSILSLVKRFSKEFDDPYVTRSLYLSLVAPILEYANVVWMPFFKCDVKRIESVQKQFLIFALRNLG